MKAVVLLMIISSGILVDQGLCQEITLSSCNNGIIRWMWTRKYKYEIELCLFNVNSTCYKSVMPITFNESNMPCTDCDATDCKGSCTNISHILETFVNCTPNQVTTSTPDCSTFTSISTTTSKNLTQNILIALLALSVVLLMIVTIGWVCTCWVMHKSRKRELNINTTNIRYSEMQATNGNNTAIQPSCSQVHNNNPNRMSLHQNQAYGAGPEKTSPDTNADREYEVIPPLTHETTRLNNAEPKEYRETPNIQTGEEIPRQTAPRQPQEEEEGEGSRMQSGQVMMENGEYKDLQIGNENVYHILEPKAEDDEDNTAPYEVPVLTKTKKN